MKKELLTKSAETIVLEICSTFCGFEVQLDYPMKSLGYLDSFSNMELLATIAKTLKIAINWKANFNTLDSPQSFLDILRNNSDHWQIAFCDPWEEEK